MMALILSPPLPAFSLPTGLSSHSGPTLTNAVLGYINVTSLLAYNASCQYPYGTSLQLNVMLLARTWNGDSYYFWLQNVAVFLTNESEVYFEDNVWNTTTPFAGISNVTGNGGITPTFDPFYHSSLYAYPTPEMSYTLPLSFYLLTRETYNTSGVKVTFSYVILQNRDVLPPDPVTYDTVFIPVQGLKTANIVVNDSTTPNVTLNQGLFNQVYLGNLLDAELVWGGYRNGESTTFHEMSSRLALFYNDTYFVPFNSVYSYGNDTRESANDLRVTLGQDGDACVTVGRPDYGLITDEFHPLFPGFTFLNVTSEVPFLVNGTLVKGFQDYLTHPVSISFLRNYSLNSSSFAVLLYPRSNLTVSPSSTFENITVTPTYKYYYLLRIHSPIALLFNISGDLVLSNGSIWLPQGSVISLARQVYPVSPEERLVVENVSQSLPLTVNSPVNLSTVTVKEYEVNVGSTLPVKAVVNGRPTTLNGTAWLPEGSVLRLEVQLPFYEEGEFVGTYNFTSGEQVAVNGPIREELLVTYNYSLLIPAVSLLMGATLLVGVAILKRK